jgi:preprotein translocase subunit SecE
LTYPALMRHQVKDHADLFGEVKEEKKKIAWDAPSKKADAVKEINNEQWEGQ